MRDFLVWWSIMAKHPAYGRARVLAVLCAVDLAAMVYFTRTGDLGWVFPLMVVFFILSSSLFEALGYAFQSMAAVGFEPRKRSAAEILEELEDEEEYEEEDEEGNWQPAAAYQPQQAVVVFAGDIADYWEGPEEDQQVRNSDLNEAQKLILCQFFSFVFAVVEYELVGQTLWESRGMPQIQYRQWIHILAAPGIEVVRVRNGAKPQVIEGDVRAALSRIAIRSGKNDYWEFPIWYFYKQPDAASYWEDPNSPDLLAKDGQPVKFNLKKKKDEETPLLPMYVTKLNLVSSSYKV